MPSVPEERAAAYFRGDEWGVSPAFLRRGRWDGVEECAAVCQADGKTQDAQSANNCSETRSVACSQKSSVLGTQ